MLQSERKRNLFRMVLAAVFLALAYVLPFLTAQIPRRGNMLCPMHLPVLVCGFVCGPVWGAAVGFLAPILRTLTIGIPVPTTAIAMCAELATYGLVSGLMYRSFPGKAVRVYASLLVAMIAGRGVYGVMNIMIYAVKAESYTPGLFLTSAFTNAVPGILLQIGLIPVIVLALEKAFPQYMGKKADRKE